MALADLATPCGEVGRPGMYKADPQGFRGARQHDGGGDAELQGGY